MYPTILFAMLTIGGYDAHIMVPSGDNEVAIEIHQSEGTTPDTAIIMIGGSGANTTADVAPAVGLFQNENVAVILHDRRGNGRSTGEFERPSTLNSQWLIPAIASDVADIASYLDEQGFQHIGVAGSSMGAWIAASAAAQSDEVDFLIGIVGGAVSVSTSDAYDGVFSATGSLDEALVAARNAPTDISYNPAHDLSTLEQPGLWIFGEMDTSNPTSLDAAALDAHIQSGQDFQYIIVENATHELQDADTGQFNGSWIPQLQAFIAEQRNDQ